MLHGTHRPSPLSRKKMRTGLPLADSAKAIPILNQDSTQRHHSEFETRILLTIFDGREIIVNGGEKAGCSFCLMNVVNAWQFRGFEYS